jgi:hypothetical protein
LQDWRGVAKQLAGEEPSYPPGCKHTRRFYDINFGYLMATAVECISRQSFTTRLSALTADLGIADECFCGNMLRNYCLDTPTSRVASINSRILADLMAATTTMQRSAAAAAAAASLTSTSSSSASAPVASDQHPHTSLDSLPSIESKLSLVSEENGDAEDSTAPTSQTYKSHLYQPVQSPQEIARAAMESLAAAVDEDGGPPLDADDLSALPPYLLEPGYFNHPDMRAACIPSANAHASARALAKIYAALSNDGEVDGTRILCKGRVSKMMQAMFDSKCDNATPAPSSRGRVAYGAGLRLYDVKRKSGRVQELAAIGSSGIGGTIAFAIPGERFSIAVTVNRLNVVSAAVAAVVVIVCRTLNVPVPIEFAKLELKARARAKGHDLAAALKAISSDFSATLSS